MTRFTLTKISSLSIGDRFYLASDKKKSVLEKVIPSKRKYKKNHNWAQTGSENKLVIAINDDTNVVF